MGVNGDSGMISPCHHSPAAAVHSHDSTCAGAGDEFYIKGWSQLEGMCFDDVLISFPMATPVGIKVAETGEVMLNPEGTYILAQGAHLPSWAEPLVCSAVWNQSLAACQH